MARPFFPEVSVNGHVIDRTLIAAEAQNHAAPPGKPGWAWQAAARALAIRSVLLQRGMALGLNPTPELNEDGLRETEDEALVRAVIEAEITPEPADEAALQALHAKEGDVRPYEEARADLLAAHEMAAWGRAAQAYIGTLVSKATITGVTWDRPDGAGAKGQAGMR
ncbi:hypothetical protein LGT41_0010990 [Abyssibius alkaniclasticus]|uniref:hypothetical protein n=1 Tax=Abyssibius alkaniclasticus TaxID=2881234 RepID=UPI0023644BE2|nr:hypothetical protein [Abyssibius alkaniclasticus]UPH70322.1 hypothetical protein LGT41_0010990 [Abyssibius alkaniclasticus]|tara:strand:- start:544 stop:1041 length:498 start_codon:yes stop_codon:yes gene_type:complete